MDIVVFGSGKIYAKYREYLKDFNIICIADNNSQKQGTRIDGKRVISPYDITEFKYDIILIMTEYHREIKKQLLNMSIPEEKIAIYTQLGDLLEKKIRICREDGQWMLNEWAEEFQAEKKVMLITPNFSYSGAPVATLNMAKVLKKAGYRVVIAGLGGGGLIREVKDEKIDFIIDIDMFYSGKQFINVLQEFDFVVVSTIILNDLTMAISQIQKSIIWWIHESDEAFYKGRVPIYINSNVCLLACSSRVTAVLRKYIRNEQTDTLYYCIPEAKKRICEKKDGVKTVFAVIGTICNRKAQDILAGAINILPGRYRGNFELLVIGSIVELDYWQLLEKEFLQMKEVTIMGEISQAQVEEQYKKIDVLVCPSRDDPMPVVVTQAMMHCKTCIVSENVGQAEFIKQRENGMIFRNEDVNGLAEEMAWAMDHFAELQKMGQEARKIYEDKFTEESMYKKMKEILPVIEIV